jgi:lipopolysaccharide export system protein LptC
MASMAGDFGAVDGGWSSRRAAAFERAARESRRVRRLRVTLPAIGAVLALVVVGTTIVSRISIGLSFGDLKISSDGLSMDAPHLSGSDGKGRTYSVTAASALQSLTDTRIIHLKDISARVGQADGTTANFSADKGVYDAGAQTMTLTDNIRIKSSDGSSAALQTAVIDLSTGAVRSDGPVAFTSNLGEIQAKDMGVTNKAGTVTFGGGVRMTVDPKGVEAPNPLKDSLSQAGKK